VNAERLAELFAEAVERDADGRRQLVAEIAAADPDLAAELERLLAAAAAGSVLDRSPWSGLGADETAVDLPLPQRIGPYQVVRELGRGGMGRVFLALEETEHFRRKVAVKVIDRPASDAEAVRRFRDEVRILASLEHPGIARFLAGGRAPDGSWFLALEHVEGEDLIAHAASRQLTVRGRVELFVGIVDAVDFAHRRGVVHRDLKPANLLVGGDGRPRLLDFGISKLVAPEGEQTVAVALTRTGLRALTPAYASPEQFRGERVSPATDVYALGVVLYELLAGRRPFDAAGASAVAIERAVLETDPEPPSAAARRPPTAGAVSDERPAAATPPAAGPREVGRDLDAVCLKALRKRPEERYPTAGELAADLRRYLGGQPVEARRGGRRYRLARLAHRHRGRLATAAALALALAAVAVVAGFWLGTFGMRDRGLRPVVRFQRITDMVGLEESPALSPDGRTVAFAAAIGKARQLFVQLVAGGPPLRITSDAADHQSPRWLPDSSGLVYFSPASAADGQGGIWEVPALGGTPRRVIGSISDADVAVDGRLACFRVAGGHVELAAFSRDGSVLQVLGQFAGGRYYRSPRWSPDGRWIAYEQGDGVRFDVFAVRSDGTAHPAQLTRDSSLVNGLSWTPDSRSVVYSSSRNSTLPYLPRLGLWQARLDGGGPEPITSDEASYSQPDIHRTGALAASRLRLQSDLWKFPVDGPPAENVRHGLRLTRQTGQVRTPTVSPTDSEVAFLSDSGGHSNLWVMALATGELRQITHERDPEVAVGVPIWSPDGRSIVFVSSQGNVGFVFGLWLVHPDGSGLRNLAQRGWGAAWSPDARWLYYVDGPVLKKISASGGPAVTVRSEQMRNVAGVGDGTVYYVVERPLVDGRPEFEFHAATPEDGPSRIVGRVPASRVASWQIVNPSLSPDGKWLALPLTDGFTTNVWALSTSTGEWRQITDFGDRATLIARRMSWSADGRFIVAAVADGDADIVLLEGLPGRKP
jgi:serine/threonine protein kinase/Tol biopolymer transport system component